MTDTVTCRAAIAAVNAKITKECSNNLRYNTRKSIDSLKTANTSIKPVEGRQTDRHCDL